MQATATALDLFNFPGLLPLHRQALHAGRPLQSFRDTGLRKDDFHLTLAQEKPASFSRQIRIHRQVGAPSLENGNRSHHLFPALFHDDRHQAVRACTQLAQAPCEASRMSMHVFIAQPASPGRYGGVVGALAHLFEKWLVQQTLRERTRGVVHDHALRRLRRWKQVGLGLAPCFIVQCEPPQEAAVGAEHIVQQSRRKKLFDRIPTQVEMAPALIDLMIEIHLRRLEFPHHR